MAKTFSEKILGEKAGREVSAGDVVTVSPDFYLSHDNSAAISRSFYQLGVDKVAFPGKMVIVLDHVVPASEEKYAGNHKAIREFVAAQGLPHFFDINSGICHQVFSESGFAMPGELILGADSHTPTYGALGAFSAGIGRSEMAVLWATGEIWLRVPETLKIELTGRFSEGTGAKDLILHIIGNEGADRANYMAVEYAGPAAAGLSISSRMVLCNMSAEMGAKNGYFSPDDETGRYLEGRARRRWQPVCSDNDARFAAVLKYELSELVPQVACPHTVDNVCPVTEIEGRTLHQVVIGTCTNGRMEDLEAAAAVLKGRKVHSATRTLIIPASQQIYLQALKTGLMEIFLEAGCVVLNSGCGPCLGAHQGILAPGETALSTANRNFRGRMGSRDSEIYLASPVTAAASALHGRITDPRKEL
ncbi:MAG: 3-isopropylmalate dehydratase large subunit [Candidatus Aminicenantes bacterium]